MRSKIPNFADEGTLKEISRESLNLNRLKLGLFDEILTAGDQKRLGGCMNGLNKLSIKHRLTFNHKLANSMSEKAKQGRFMKSVL